jgi:hypothetical protein
VLAHADHDITRTLRGVPDRPGKSARNALEVRENTERRSFHSREIASEKNDRSSCVDVPRAVVGVEWSPQRPLLRLVVVGDPERCKAASDLLLSEHRI